MQRFLLGLGVAGALACGGTKETPPVAETPAVEATGEGHAHEAPHGGSLVEFGEEFAHLELVVDTATGRLTAYSLDGEAENAVPLTQGTIELALVAPPGTDTIRVSLAGQANSLSGETPERTSVFAADVPALKGKATFTGMVRRLESKGQVIENTAFSVPSEEH